MMAPPSSTEELAAEVRGFTWAGMVPYQKWSNLYMKVLSKFASPGALTIHVSVDVRPKGGIPKTKIDEVKVALRELGLEENVRISDDE